MKNLGSEFKKELKKDLLKIVQNEFEEVQAVSYNIFYQADPQAYLSLAYDYGLRDENSQWIEKYAEREYERLLQINAFSRFENHYYDKHPESFQKEFPNQYHLLEKKIKSLKYDELKKLTDAVSNKELESKKELWEAKKDFNNFPKKEFLQLNQKEIKEWSKKLEPLRRSEVEE